MQFTLGVARNVFGIEQTLIAERSGLSRKSIGDYASGRAFPSRATCKLIDETMLSIVMERARAELTERLAGLPPPEPLPASKRYDKLDEEMAGASE
jgi:predicted transcriptional regulator